MVILKVLFYPLYCITELVGRWNDERVLRKWEREWHEWECAYRREVFLQSVQWRQQEQATSAPVRFDSLYEL